VKLLIDLDKGTPAGVSVDGLSQLSDGIPLLFSSSESSGTDS
jgi:hypothetical protein